MESPLGVPGEPRWVHRSARGVELGVERPTGVPLTTWAAFVAAATQTWTMREALWVLVLKDFKSRYRAQALGLFWSLAHPLVMMVTVTVAFQYVLGVSIPNFAVFYLIGAVFWQFCVNATLAALGSLVDNAGAVKQTTFPRFLFPIAAVLSHLIHLGMDLVLVFAFYLFFPNAYRFNATLVALPLIVGAMLVFLVGAALLTSGLFVKYRDLHYIVTSLFTVGFWATPIIYPLTMAPPSLQALIRLNPMTGIVEGARAVLMRGEWPAAHDLVPTLLVGSALFAIGCAVFRRQNRVVADFA
jgi:lipopolysaccharide transport system permease protein